MMHFASELFDTHPRYVQLKSLLMDLFNGEQVDEICLAGLEHVISVTLAPSTDAHGTGITGQADPGCLPKVHVRTYTVTQTRSGTRVPRVQLTEMGPSLDLTLRRWQEADPDMWKAAMKRPKLKKQDVEKGLGKRKRNVEVDEMGDVRGRVHVAKQDLGKLQTRKMKGLKLRLDDESGDELGVDGDEEQMRRKRARR